MTKTFFYRIFCGFFLGFSNFTPGFSGSVVAITVGIYQDLVRSVSNPLKQLKQNILFCLPLISGAVIGAIFLSMSSNFSLILTKRRSIFSLLD